MSAISIDLLKFKYNDSHRKKAYSLKGNTAYHKGKRIRDKNTLTKINLSQDELTFLKGIEHDVHFRNGINVSEQKHKDYLFRIYYIVGLKSSSYGDIIEKRWRNNYGLPRLCTYKKGR